MKRKSLRESAECTERNKAIIIKYTPKQEQREEGIMQKKTTTTTKNRRLTSFPFRYGYISYPFPVCNGSRTGSSSATRMQCKVLLNGYGYGNLLHFPLRRLVSLHSPV